MRSKINERIFQYRAASLFGFIVFAVYNRFAWGIDFKKHVEGLDVCFDNDDFCSDKLFNFWILL